MWQRDPSDVKDFLKLASFGVEKELTCTYIYLEPWLWRIIHLSLPNHVSIVFIFGMRVGELRTFHARLLLVEVFM